MAATAGPSDESKIKDEKVKEEKEDGEKRDEKIFECNICLDTARDAVVSMCGHLFW